MHGCAALGCLHTHCLLPSVFYPHTEWFRAFVSYCCIPKVWEYPFKCRPQEVQSEVKEGKKSKAKKKQGFQFQTTAEMVNFTSSSCCVGLRWHVRTQFETQSSCQGSNQPLQLIVCLLWQLIMPLQESTDRTQSTVWPYPFTSFPHRSTSYYSVNRVNSYKHKQ